MAKTRSLFILVEGVTDERFVEQIFKPLFFEKYDSVLINQYSQLKNKQVKNLLKSFDVLKADYIYITDFNDAPCISAKKDDAKNSLGKNIKEDNIAVTIKEIESWFLAGLTEAKSKQYKIKSLNRTEGVTKEKFVSMLPKRFDSKIDFMAEIIKVFSIPTARNKNKSFDYFFKKFIQ